jgi:hypothetical protein
MILIHNNKKLYIYIYILLLLLLFSIAAYIGVYTVQHYRKK